MTIKMVFFVYLAAINLVLFAVMGLDKARARRRARRVPEATLFFLALIGGALGGTLGMLAFRHKTRHASFFIGFPVMLAVQAALMVPAVLKMP